jgi:hypothetical protein
VRDGTASRTTLCVAARRALTALDVHVCRSASAVLSRPLCFGSRPKRDGQADLGATSVRGFSGGPQIARCLAARGWS